MGRQPNTLIQHAVNEDHPLFPTSKKINHNFEKSLYYDMNCYSDQGEMSVGGNSTDSGSYSSCEDQNMHNGQYIIRKLVPTEPYWKRVANSLDKNKKNIMMGCVMFVLISLFIISTVYFVKSLLMNNIVLLSICAIMGLLAILIISILMIIWLTKYGKSYRL